jgi:hypothetical protein
MPFFAWCLVNLPRALTRDTATATGELKEYFTRRREAREEKIT